MHAFTLQQFWINGLLVVPAAAAVWMACRVLRLRAATRHALWMLALSLLALPSVVLTVVPQEWSRTVNDMVRPWLREAEIAIDDSASQAATPHLNDMAGFGSVPAPYARSTSSAPRRPSIATGSGRHTRQIDSVPALSEGATEWRGGDLGENAVSMNSFHESLRARPDVSPPVVDAELYRSNSRGAAWFEMNRQEFVEASKAQSDSSDASPADAATLPDVIEPADVPPVEHTPAAATTGAFDSWRSYINEWVVSARAMRDVFVRLPALPGAFWIAGALVIGAVLIMRLFHVRRLVRAAEPAGADVLTFVRRAARRIDLTGVPETRMTSADVPPMVWCARRPILVLPRRLWSQLDDASRLAVIFHELAHLRRRDHVLCWLEMLAAIVFWWNPAVWWVCRQVRDEADACCDAWVVRLQPTGRRAYAQALLASTHMYETVAFAGPVVGLGALRPRTRRLARRLTMVMTEHLKPGHSLRGLAAIAALGAAACLVAPIAACPPEEETKSKQKEKELVTAAAIEAKQRSQEADEAASTYEAFVRDREAQLASGDYAEALAAYTIETSQDPFASQGDVNARLDALEARLDQIAGLLEQLAAGGNLTPDFTLETGRSSTTATRADVTFGGDDVITHTYALPEGKLKELTDLMILQDVPILVTPRVEEGVIDVHATPAHHEIFGAFLSIIHPEGVKQSSQAPADEAKKRLTTTTDITSHSAQLKAKQQDLSSVLESAKQRAAGHADQAGHLEQAIEELEEEIEAIEEKTQEATGDDKKLLNDHARALKQQMKQLENALRQQEREIEKAEEEIDDVEASLESIDEDLEDLADMKNRGAQSGVR